MLLPDNFEDVCMCDSVVDPDQCLVAAMEALFSHSSTVEITSQHASNFWE